MRQLKSAMKILTILRETSITMVEGDQFRLQITEKCESLIHKTHAWTKLLSRVRAGCKLI